MDSDSKVIVTALALGAVIIITAILSTLFYNLRITQMYLDKGYCQTTQSVVWVQCKGALER
jgi:hypothetical protein